MNYSRLTLAVAALILGAAPAFANWSFNLGYNNPPGATVGGNFLYRGSQLGFEIGIGWIDAHASKSKDADQKNDDDDDEEDNGTVGLALAGDIDMKYFFGRGGVTPYVQGGFGLGMAGAVGDDGGASVGLGGPYAGLGLMAGGNDLYLYLSGNMNSSQNTFVQAGIGFDI